MQFPIYLTWILGKKIDFGIFFIPRWVSNIQIQEYQI